MSGDMTPPLRWLAVLIVLSSFRMPPTVLLERRLAYLPLTAAESADTVTFYVVAVGAAMAGAGLWSFVAGAPPPPAGKMGVVLRPTPWRAALLLGRGVRARGV